MVCLFGYLDQWYEWSNWSQRWKNYFFSYLSITWIRPHWIQGNNRIHKTDFAIFTVLPCVISWAMCLTDKYLWKTSPNKIRGKSTTPATSKKELFVKLVNAVNYCHNDIYYWCYRGPRYASETCCYKRFYRKIMSKQQKSSKTIFQGATFLGEVFPVGNFPKPYFCGVIFRGQFSRGLFAGGDFFLRGIFPDTTVQSFLKWNVCFCVFMCVYLLAV